MRKNLKSNWLVIAVIVLLTLASCGGGEHAEHTDTYTCPMHPTVISDRPSTCPVCGMDLVRKARPGEEVEITEDLAKLLKSPNETVIASIKTIKALYKSVPSSVEAQGVVTYDTRNIFTIPSRVGGRLEKIFLKYEFQPVAKGQKIAEIYSPELLTVQRELLFLIENDSENKSLIDGAKNKLELLGLTSLQIDNLVARKTTTQTLGIYSAYSGYLITGQQTPTTSISISSTSVASSSGMSDGMGASSSTSSTGTSQVSSTGQTGSIIREGAYVSAGQTLFRIVNTSDLRIELDLAASQAGAIKKGDKLSLDFGTGSIEETTIDFVQPFFNEGQDFLKLRVFTNKTKDLHIGHLVSAKIQVPASESLWVPREAVLDMGKDKIVFLKERGVLKPKKVKTGISSEGLVEIKSGLASSDEIAANAQYLIDSESFIKTAK
jgi:membrane fusion protein, copper/silver efflux system